jgi:hypothetical protein
MEVVEAKDVLARALRALDKVKVTGWRENLAYHLEHETTILCGSKCWEWADGEGGG